MMLLHLLSDCHMISSYYFFFFQAEDGIRDLIVTGVQTCALPISRLAVGDHILLGGDNVDLALAHAVNEQLKARGTRLDSWQFTALMHACRGAKEAGTTALAIPGRGSGLVGGTIRAEIAAADLRRTV